MFRFLKTEDDLDDFIAEEPELAGLGNEIQAVQEDDETRVLMKRVTCLLRLHFEHDTNSDFVDARCELGEATHIYFSALDEITDDFVTGAVDAEKTMQRAERVRKVMECLLEDENPGITHTYRTLASFAESSRFGLLRRFDANFVRMLAVEFVSRQHPPYDEDDDEEARHSPWLGA